MGEVLVTMEGIEKTFPGIHALEQAKFELRSGEVHTLVSENGAGKSTLMKVLTGIYRPYAGVISYKGVPVEIPNPRAGQLLGISMIHQELNLMPHLTIAQNIFRLNRCFWEVLSKVAARCLKTGIFLWLH